MTREQWQAIKESITMDDVTVFVIGAGSIYQLLNKKVPTWLGTAGTALTILAMLRTIKTLRELPGQPQVEAPKNLAGYLR